VISLSSSNGTLLFTSHLQGATVVERPLSPGGNLQVLGGTIRR
jgi:hypothetical protein